MNIATWSKSEVDYGRKLVDSAVEGARRGESEFLKDEALGRYFERSALHAVVPTIVGASLGWFGGYWENRRSRNRALVCAFLGGAVGFAAGVVWENRKLTASVASGAWKNIKPAAESRSRPWMEQSGSMQPNGPSTFRLAKCSRWTAVSLMTLKASSTALFS
jgi:hypothetical protein